MGVRVKRSGRQKSSEVGGVAVAAITLLIVIIATQNYWPDTVTLNAKGVSEVALEGSGKVREPATAPRSATQSGLAMGSMLAYAKSLLLTDASGQVDLVLPVPATDCDVLREDTNTACTSDGAQFDQPISAAWTAARQLEVPAAAGDEIALATVSQQADDSVSFSVTGGGPLRLCIGQAADSAPFSLTIGSIEVTFPVRSVIPICGGLVVAFRSSFTGTTSGFILRSLTYISTQLHGERLTLAADSIRLTAHSTGTDSNYDGGGLMTVISDKQFVFTASGAPPGLIAKDQIVDGATSVREADVERLPNIYNHFTWISYLVTLIGALIALLVWRLVGD